MTGHAYSTKIVPVARRPLMPASFTQQERLEVGRHVEMVNNKIAIALRIDGTLDFGALRRSMELLVSRHEALRLVFPEQGSGFHLSVTPPTGDSLSLVEAIGETTADRLQDGLRRLADDACREYNLAAGPLFRATLATIDPDLHILCLAMDHIISDGWSLKVATDELLEAYAAYTSGRAPALPELTVQFPDYAEWERQYLTGHTLEELSGYWKQQLDGIDAIPASGLVDESMKDDAPPGLLGVAKVVFGLGKELTDSMCLLAQTQRVSMTAVVAAAVKATMWHYRSRTMPDEAAGDVAVFGSLANRTRPETQHMIGYLATVATLRTRFSGSNSFAELIRLESDTLLNALRHQRIPHSLIMKELGSPLYGARHRDPAEMPSYLNFDIDMVDSAADPLVSPAGLRVTFVSLPVPEVPRGGLRIIGFLLEDGLSIEFRYRRDRFSGPWADGFTRKLKSCLTAGTAMPSARLLDIFQN